MVRVARAAEGEQHGGEVHGEREEVDAGPLFLGGNDGGKDAGLAIGGEHGGIGLTTDLPIERMWRQQRSYRITEGAGEVMRTVIARHVMKAYA